ncbi:ATP-binding cassette domain-containing protein [Craterilacuibacter sp.]|uniref:ATP-binding cassette domain-containing protein n=1 Tax=Craterilacuibacter sp. TaxID=2870909 RepID=UPI003F3070AA
MIEIAVEKRLDGAQGGSWLRVDCRWAAGQRMALFGASGAGKTTLLRILAGLIRPDAGRIVVGGEVWFDSDKNICLPAQARQVGMVFQDYALFPHLSVRGNLEFAQRRKNPGRVDELLALTGLAALACRKPATLSGGQQQRVALARALAAEPRLLLLDEPLSALDPVLREQLQAELLALQQCFALSTVLVSHDLAEVFRLAQQVIRLDAGQVTGMGTPAELFLAQSGGGRFHLAAQVLALRRVDVVDVASLLVGGQIVDVVLDEGEAASLVVGASVTVAAKGFSPLIL